MITSELSKLEPCKTGNHFQAKKKKKNKNLDLNLKSLLYSIKPRKGYIPVDFIGSVMFKQNLGSYLPLSQSS